MRLSGTLSRYIVRQFLLAFTAVLLVVCGIVLLFDVIELIRRAASRPDLSFMTILGMGALKLPRMIHTLLPFAVMIGAMIAFWRLTRTHELVVARSAGISVWQFLTPVIGVVFLIGVIELTAFNPMAAAMYTKFERLEDERLRGQDGVLDVSDGGLWLREGDANGQKVLHADEVRQAGLELNLRNVHIFLYDSQGQFLSRLFAQSGYLDDGVFQLDNVLQLQGGKPTVHQDHMSLPTQLTMERIHDNFSSPETMSFWQLPGFIDFFEKAGFSANKHRMYFQSLLASPLLYCAMVLIGALFTLKPNIRSGGLLGRIGGGVLAGFLIYFFTKVSYAFGLTATLPQGLAAWSPAIVASLIGLSGLLHLEDG